jgi:hypothetical protein
MSITPLVTTVAAESSAEQGINPWLVGVVIFAILLLLMGGLLAFGAGRDHS